LEISKASVRVERQTIFLAGVFVVCTSCYLIRGVNKAKHATSFSTMSRFFRSVGDSDSESSSSEEELMSSGEDEEKPMPVRPAGGMSRFLRTAGSDSSSEVSDEDESVSDEDERKQKKKNRFAPDTDEEESEDEVKRVVRSAKDKRVDEMEACAKSMDNALKINDWVAISSGNEYTSSSN
jgi:translation initiation factor 3 subunit C